MYLWKVLSAMLLAEIHKEMLEDAVHAEFILGKINKLQSAFLIFARKGGFPNQLAYIQHQRIEVAVAMESKSSKHAACYANLFQAWKFAHGLSQFSSDVFINTFCPQQSFQGRKND